MVGLYSWLLLVCALVVARAAEGPALTPPTVGNHGWMVVRGTGPTNRVVTVEASTNLLQWAPIAVIDPRLRVPDTEEIYATNEWFSFVDPGSASLNRRFYRFAANEITASNDWKNQVLLPDDAFASLPGSEGAGTGIRWVKFAIPFVEPTRVYYQDSRKYLLHHDFAGARLGPFVGLNRAEFDRLSLFTEGQQILLGTLLIGPENHPGEYAIQFSGRDPYPREMVRRFFELACSTVVAAPGATAFYFPVYEQSQAAAADSAYFAANGIRVSSVNRWTSGDQLYSAGWALGRLRFFHASEIGTAYLQGRLGPGDILLTDGVPAEVPFVAGIISLVPATPNSHLAILAGSYGVPFVYLSNSADQNRALQLNGREAVLQAVQKDGFAQVQLIDVEGALDPGLRAELLALKTSSKPQIRPKAKYGKFSAAVDQLVPDDIRFFGGKAANFGLLRRIVPSNSPPAIAFSFDLWEAFLDQEVAGGVSLRSEISRRLSHHAYPPVMSSLAADVSAIRDLITKTAGFTPEQRADIVSALGVFDPARNIRFRSSSNAEDTECFSAAGMYDSYSGCLADDLDPDLEGPCRCDLEEAKERGVFRAIQKVYASFYNDNAVLERLRRGLDESQLAMGVLVHHSTPDEFELANGVATVSKENSPFGESQLRAVLVTQDRAVSVTNPEGNAKPEVIEATPDNVGLKEPSSLMPLGTHVMDWTADYERLRDLLFKVYQAYRGPSNLPLSRQSPTLDFEYKKIVPGSLLLKQVRAMPKAATNASAARYLFNEPTTYWVYQSESSDALANHRLKCFLTLETGNLRVESSNLTQCFYSNAKFETHDGTSLQTISGSMRDWPGAVHSLTNDPQKGTVVRDGWTIETSDGTRQYQLTSVIPSAADGPFVRQAEIRKWLSVVYPVPVTTLDWRGGKTTTSEEEVQLVSSPDLASLRAGQTETFTATNHLQFEISFLTSTNGSGAPLGIDKNFWGTYPAALSPWMRTVITGLIGGPIELTGYWSQSSKAGHKYRYAWHVFEPALEPNLPAEEREQLRAANIQLIYVERETWPGGNATVSIIGIDGTVRLWP